MGAQQDIVVDKKRILHVPGRMVFGKIQRFEVIIIEFDLGSFGCLETKTGKYLRYLLGDKGYRMFAAGRPATARQGYIYPLLLQAFFFSRIAESRQCTVYLFHQAVTDNIDALPDYRAFFRRKQPQALFYESQGAFLSQIFYPDFLDFFFAGGAVQLGQGLL